MSLMLLIVLIVLILQRFELTCGIVQRSDVFLKHRLCSRIRDDQPQGYAAFDWESILHGQAGILGDYKELAILPDKIASYLYEYHADSYPSHALPLLPVDRSDIDVHGILKAPQVLH